MDERDGRPEAGLTVRGAEGNAFESLVLGLGEEAEAFDHRIVVVGLTANTGIDDDADGSRGGSVRLAVVGPEQTSPDSPGAAESETGVDEVEAPAGAEVATVQDTTEREVAGLILSAAVGERDREPVAALTVFDAAASEPTFEDLDLGLGEEAEAFGHRVLVLALRDNTGIDEDAEGSRGGSVTLAVVAP